MITSTVEAYDDITMNNLFVKGCKVVATIIDISNIMLDFQNSRLDRRRTMGWGFNRSMWGHSRKVLEECLEVFIAVFRETLENTSKGFIRQGSNLIQTNQSRIYYLVINKTFLHRIVVKPLLSKYWESSWVYWWHCRMWKRSCPEPA